MEIESNYLSPLEAVQPIETPRWDATIARWVSWIFSPPLLVVIGIALVAAVIGTPSAWIWAGFYTLMAVLLPVLYIVWKVRQGEITDFHIKLREQRFRPMLVMLVLSIIGWLAMALGEAPYPLLIFASAGVIQVAFLLVVTLRWKISGHSTAAAGFSVFIYALFGPSAAPGLLLIPLVAWARIRRSRHELTQTIAGSFAGITYMLVVLYLVSLNSSGLSL
jgi:membrane-associated HD superfamily phosphohydrolase